MMKYKVVYIEADKNLENEINKLAVEGWELLTIESMSKPGLTQFMAQAGITSGFMLIFKK